MMEGGVVAAKIVPVMSLDKNRKEKLHLGQIWKILEHPFHKIKFHYQWLFCSHLTHARVLFSRVFWTIKTFYFFAENSSSSSLKNWNISCANDLSAQNVLQCVMVHVVDGSGPSNVTCHGNCSAMFSLWNVLQCVKKCRFQLNLGRITVRWYRPKICILNTFAMDWWKLLVLSR